MKYIIVLGDGMADEPIAALNNQTPLEVANTPAMDWLAKEGKGGMLQTVPDGFAPGSEIANLAVLGYDVRREFEGRGSLEAASMGIAIEPHEMAMRCNLICITPEGIIKNHSAGHISTEEANELISYLNAELGNDVVSLYTGVSYRHLLKLKGGNKALECTPPHDVPGTPFAEVLVKPLTPEAAETAELLNKLILKSQELLENHPINLKRAAAGKDKANSIWVWSAGYKPQMATFKEKYGIESGAVISAVDLIKGIGVYAGFTPLEVEGATGLYDTNYEGKLQAAVEALATNDFVYLHVEATDEAGHEGDVALKTKCIEYLDSRILQPLLEATQAMDEPVAIALLPDHPTPCELKTHTRMAVPFVIYHPDGEKDAACCYTEAEMLLRGGYGTLREEEFMNAFLNKR